MSPPCLSEATVGLAHDLTGSKGLGTGSATQVLEVNTLGKCCYPIAPSGDIISRRSRAHCVRGTHEVLRTALTLRNSSRGAEYVFPSSLPGLRTMTTPRKLVQCDIWLLAWKRHQGDLEPQACGFPVCVRRGSLWRTEASGSCLLPLHSTTIGPGFTALSS